MVKVPTTSPVATSTGISLGASPRYVANFDSTTGALTALAKCLKGKGFPGAGVMPNIGPLAALINAAPKRVRDELYKLGGLMETIPQSSAKNVRAEMLSKWATNQYPQRRYPAVAVGSTNGAATHLFAAMGIPWLPQTFLIPMRHFTVDPDEPTQGFEHFRQAARDLLEANPELQLHHMHDANQDRLMIHYLGYFRVKRRTLGESYEQFLTNCLPRGSTIFIVECGQSWQTASAPEVSDRYFFQHGAVGGAYPEEFQEGSRRVAEYLQRFDSHTREWGAPEPDGERPEAEWGFEPAMREDIERFARARGYRIVRIKFYDPEDLSPLVCDLYRWWYRRRRMKRANRLVVEQFLMQDPYWTLRTGSCPFWLTFSKQPSTQTLENYLNEVEQFDEIHAMLFSHGVQSIGLTPIDKWREMLGYAKKEGRFLGALPEKYPRDFGAFIRYHQEFQRIPARYPLPGPLDMSRLDVFLEEQGERYKVEWIEGNSAARASGASVSESMKHLVQEAI